jgi:transposase
MNNNEFINKLLNLEKVQVTQTEFAGDDRVTVTLFVESMREVAICPECRQASNSVHDLSAVQMIRDLSIAERRCYLSYRACRFDCQACGKTFVERVIWKRPGASYTVRYGQYIYERARKEPVNQIAEDEGLSEEAEQAIFEHEAHLPWRAVPGKKRLRHGGTRR